MESPPVTLVGNGMLQVHLLVHQGLRKAFLLVRSHLCTEPGYGACMFSAAGNKSMASTHASGQEAEDGARDWNLGHRSLC